MSLKPLLSRQAIKTLSTFNGRSALSSYAVSHKIKNGPSSIVTSRSPSIHFSNSPENPSHPKPKSDFHRHFHSEAVREAHQSDVRGDEEEEDVEMSEFLSRFAWIMREKLLEAYPGCDKKTIDGMLVIIVGRVVSEMEKGGPEHLLGATADADAASGDFSDDLWKTVWEVSNMVLVDMEKARKKEKMKAFLQTEEVKELYRFAGEVGVRGEMLRELRFKWAREQMEESEFYQNLDRIKQEYRALGKVEEENGGEQSVSDRPECHDDDPTRSEEKVSVISIPKRRGKLKYKIYGLDLSDPEWAQVAHKIHESEEKIWPQEPKPISGKCKLVTERILALQEGDDPSQLFAEWVELLQPSRVDWISLLDRFKEKNSNLYLQLTERVLSESSFQANVHDYLKLMDVHAKENRLADTERIFLKMNENGVSPDILAWNFLANLYSKAGELDRAREAFELLKKEKFQPDIKLYNSMIMAYVNANMPKFGETLVREMEASELKPTKEIYMALLRSFAQCGDASGAHRISTTMQIVGFQLSLESLSLIVEAHGRAGDPDQARSNFDYMLRLGHKPDDRCIASVLAAYEKKNSLDKALNLLLQLEENGYELGFASYTVLLDWMSKLQLVEEAEQILHKISELGESPPIEVHVSLCEMYSKAGIEKKALQALGVLEARNGQLGQFEFERTVSGLLSGGFTEDARRILGLMEAQGFSASEKLKVTLMASQDFGRKKAAIR